MAKPLFSWDRLLGLIDDRKVVPIVGQDLLRVDVKGRSVLLYRYLAERLAQKLGVEIPGEDQQNPLHQAAARHLEAGGEWLDVYSTLKSLLPEITALPLPDALLKLAQIRSLKLFVTTTFDPLLARALNQVRYGGDAVTEVLSFSPSTTMDLPDPLPPEQPATVFHLLGKISASPDYAVTEDDTVEFIHGLQSNVRRPTNLFRELAQRDLLIVGNSFDDWLARFFIRSTKQERLWMASTRSGFVADDRIRANEALLLYLRHSPYVKVFTEGGPIDFVNTLYDRWSERQAELEQEREAAGPAAADEAEIIPGCVFVSYATENRSAAQKIADALRGAKIDVWIDLTGLRSGDAFGPRIRSAIQQAAAFVPVISQAIDSGKRYFWSEWNFALRESENLPPSARYILPVVIDETRYDDPLVPEPMRNLTWERISQEGPSESWIETVRQTVRQYRKQMMG